MAPVSDKGKATKPSQNRDQRRSKSRNTTPVSVSVTVEPTTSHTYFNTSITAFTLSPTTNIEDVLERNGSGSAVPTFSQIGVMQEKIKSDVVANIRTRGELCERIVRELNLKRKERVHLQRERAQEDREAEERKRKLKKMTSKRESEERPLAVGEHRVARQDGVDVHKEASSSRSSPLSQAPPSAGTAPPESAPSPSNSDVSHQPPPAKAVPKFQTFGPDPAKFDDPTIYHIREVTPGMSEELKKEIYGVTMYPESDLHDLTCGTPPDKDFSNPKPTQQVAANTFANFVEPFIRPLTEEDVAFLKERGDRLTPFIMPARGTRHYKDLWAEEDTGMLVDPKPENNPHEGRGTIDQLTDDTAETDQISAGPAMCRLLSLLRPASKNATDVNGDTNGDTAMELDEPAQTNGSSVRFPPAAHMAETEQPNWKPISPPASKTDYSTLDDRLFAELRHIGIIGLEETPNYAAHADDEVAARIRYLQAELRRVSIMNGARKARVYEETMNRMAKQEYMHISDDLDNQLNQAYLKRNRNMGKGKKVTKRPGGAGGGSHPAPGLPNRNGVGEPIRLLMERKSMWNGLIGPVVDDGKAKLPDGTIFGEEEMKKYVAHEQENWDQVEE